MKPAIHKLTVGLFRLFRHVTVVFCVFAAASAQADPSLYERYPGLEKLSRAIARPGPGVTDLSLRKDIEFLGFSYNEQLGVWRVAYQRHHVTQGCKVVDSFVITSIVQAESREVVGSFRHSGITRKILEGPKKRFDDIAIEQDNPEYIAARPKKEWTPYQRKLKLHRHVMPMNDSAVRLFLDNDIEPDVHVEEQQLTAFSKVGQALGFQPIARIMDGNFINLGHYRLQGIEGVTLSSTIEVFRSRSGRSVAVICRFFKSDDETFTTSYATITTTGKEPIATNTIGQWQMLEVEIRQGGEIFEEQFPELKNMFNFYVGKEW